MKKIDSLKNTQFIYIALLVAVFLIGYFFAKVQYLENKGLTANQQPSVQAQQPPQGNQIPNNQPQAGTKVDVANGHIARLGNTNAKVTIIEFSDFQCPYCRKFWKEALTQIEKNYVDSGKVQIYYRHFLLPPEAHPMALPTALASECANEQGKFWEYNNKVNEEQAKQGEGTAQFTKDDLKTWAQDIGLNSSSFNQCLDTEKYKSNIEKDQADGSKAGVNGTPTVFINGTMLVGAQPFESFKTLIDQELKK